MSLRALVDYRASDNFVQHQSLDENKINVIERKIPPTRMTVRLATGTSVIVMKRVVGITYTLKEVQYDDDFIILDLDDKFDVILGLPWLRRYVHKSAGIAEVSICMPLVHQMAIRSTSRSVHHHVDVQRVSVMASRVVWYLV